MEQSDMFVDDSVEYVLVDFFVPWMEQDENYYVEKHWVDEHGVSWQEVLYNITIYYEK